jgi:Ca-activated chloride channel homolog
MTFIWANLLWLLLLLPLLIATYVLLQFRSKRNAAKYSNLSLMKVAMGQGPGFRRHIPPILFFISIAIMILALARPAAIVKLPSLQGTVILAMDVSGSMRADDLKPSRMDAAKEAATTFVNKQPSNVRVGVVAFSDVASIVQAPTTDKIAVLAAINRLSPQRGTAIGTGIRTSLDAIFNESGKNTPVTPPAAHTDPNQPTPVPDPVSPGSFDAAFIVLLTDGQNNVGPKPADIITEAADRGVKIFTVGIGSLDGTVLQLDGFSVKVGLDEPTLRTVAGETRGKYFAATNSEDLLRIYKDLGAQVVYKTEKIEITAGFTALAALILIASGLISLMWFSRLL